MNFEACTPREREVLSAVCEHGTDKRAAKALGISPRTVGFHMDMVRARVGVDNRVSALIAWDREQRSKA